MILEGEHSMDLRNYSSNISTNSAQPSRSSMLPMVTCPNCGHKLNKRMSSTQLNPNKVFYMCQKNTPWTSSCNFFMWEDEYKEYLRELGIVTQRSVVEHVVSDVRRNEARYDVEMGEWKKHNSRLVKLAEKIKFLVAINVFVMTIVLIVMICK